MKKDEETKHYEAIKDYLGLESIEQAKLYEVLEYELSQMGDWGTKILTYLKAILSRNRRYSSYVQKSDQEFFEGLLKESLRIFQMKLENYDKDNIQD